MGLSKVNLARDWYPLEEAAELLDAKPDDLIHLAANGKIQLYVLADKWMAERVYQYDHTIKLSDSLRESLKVKFRGPMPPELPDVDDPDFEEKLSVWRKSYDSQDLVVGNLVNYGKHGGHGALYQLILDGLVPVAAKCIGEYLIRPETAKVEVDLYRYLDMADGAQEMFLIPENSVLVKDEFDSGKLVVKNEEIRKLQGFVSDETLSELYEHPYWPNELGIAIAAWQNARDIYKPGDKPSQLIRTWLRGRYPTNDAMSNAAVERIATIANWDEKPGPAKKTDIDG